MDRYEYKSNSMSGIIRNIILFCILLVLMAIGGKVDDINNEVKKLYETIELIKMMDCKTKVK